MFARIKKSGSYRYVEDGLILHEPNLVAGRDRQALGIGGDSHGPVEGAKHHVQASVACPKGTQFSRLVGRFHLRHQCDA